MKSIVKTTGKIVEVKSKVITSSVTGKNILKYVDQKTGVSYFEEELFFPKDLADDPDYWTKLEHQYAGMAMRGIIARHNVDFDMVVEWSADLAHALVEKMKEERK